MIAAAAACRVRLKDWVGPWFQAYAGLISQKNGLGGEFERIQNRETDKDVLLERLLSSVHGYVTGPRIGLAAPGGIRFFWQLPGEIRDSAPNADADGKGGERLAEALQALLDEHLAALREEAQKKGTPAVIPDRLQVPLVMESDAPCRVKLNTLAVQYHLTRQTLCTEKNSAPSGEKIRLRFPGGKTVTRHVTVSLPAGALVAGVTLKVAPAFGANPAVALNTGSAQGQTPEEAYGIALSTERRAAFAVTPATPLTVTGLGLPLLAHANGASGGA